VPVIVGVSVEVAESEGVGETISTVDEAVISLTIMDIGCGVKLGGRGNAASRRL
jgi:hypothetical protein